jgi:hypothetical protein
MAATINADRAAVREGRCEGSWRTSGSITHGSRAAGSCVHEVAAIRLNIAGDSA